MFKKKKELTKKDIIKYILPKIEEFCKVEDLDIEKLDIDYGNYPYKYFKANISIEFREDKIKQIEKELKKEVEEK